MCLSSHLFSNRFIGLEIRSVTFDMFRDYPGHLDILVHSHLPVCGLIQIIIAETDISSTKLAVFRDRTRSPESVLSPHMTLEECGFVGDSQESPEEVVLFYDYTVEFTDCPILMCDHYFGQKEIS